MMGCEPHALPSVISDMSIPAIETCLTLSATRNEALAAHELAHQVMAACTYCSFSPFKLRDKAWLEARNLKHSIVNPKFAPNKKDLSPLWKSYPQSFTNSVYRKCEKSILSSMLHSYLPIMKMPPMAPTSHHHPLTLSMEKKNTKMRRFYATVELWPITHSWSDGKNIWLKKTLGSQSRIWNMQSLPSPHTKNSIPLSSFLNLPASPRHYYVHLCFLDIYWVLSPYGFISFFWPFFSYLYQIKCWLGTPNDHHLPTPPPNQMEPSLASLVTPPSILSNVPITAHCLHEESLENHYCDTLHSLLYAPHLNHTLKFHLEDHHSPL